MQWCDVRVWAGVVMQGVCGWERRLKQTVNTVGLTDLRPLS